MEKINRHNYEAYFLDYLEGQLSAEEKHDLLVFLDQNPDLKKELDLDLSQVVLDSSATVFADKNLLKVDDEQLLSMTTVDSWMIESVEGNLSASKQQELDDFVKKHQLEKTYTAYQSTVLKADLNEVFENKKKLKVATGIVIPMYAHVAAVAAVALLLIGIAINRPDAPETTVTESNTHSSVYAAKLGTAGLNKRNVESIVEQPSQTNFAQQERQNAPQQNGGNFLANSNEKKDTSRTNGTMLPEDNNIANQKNEPDQKEQQEQDKEQQNDDQDDVAVVVPEQHADGQIVTEEPYKIVTNAASNVTKREVYFTRDRNTATNEYVAYGFKIGNFEFERKK